MSTAHLHIDSFNSGEISPLASSRFGVDKILSGCRILKNFIIHPHGPAFRRPGMEYMGAAATDASATNLRSFQFSSSTVFVLDLSVFGLRVWQNGALVSLIASVSLPYSATELPEVQMTQINDVVYLTHPSYEPRRLTRYADTDWRFSTLDWVIPPLLDENPGSQALADVYDTVSNVITAIHPEYQFGNTGSRSFTLLTPDNSAATKQLIVQTYITGSLPNVWRTLFSDSWTGSRPAGNTGSIFKSLNPSPGTGTVNGRFRVIYVAPSSSSVDFGGGISVSGKASTSPVMGTPFAMPLGAYKIRFSTHQAYSFSMSLQSRTGAGSWSTLETFSFNALSGTETDTPEILEAFRTNTLLNQEFRWLWTNTVDIGTMYGSVTVGKISVTAPYQTSLTVSNAAVGTGRTLSANRPTFRAGHVGAYWQITHRRDNAFKEMVSTSAATAATGVLTFTAISVAAQTVTIGSRIYTWAASVTTTANTVAVGANQAASQANLVAAINGAAGAGTTYGSQTAPHADVTAAVVGSTVVVTARTAGTGAHSVTITDTMSNTSWDNVWLSGGVAANTVISAAHTDGLRVNGTWEVTSYGSWASTLYLERQTAAGTWEFVRSWRANKDRNVSTTGITDGEETLRLRILAGTSEETSTAAAPRFLLEAVDARVNGLVKITAVGTTDANGQAITATCDVIQACWDTSASYVWTEGAFSTYQGFPRAVTLHENRLWLGGTTLQPMRLWSSVTGDIENFRRSSLDDGSLSFSPAAGELNAVQWMQSQGSDLVVGTSGDEWAVNGEGKPITPTSVTYKLQSRYGSSSVPGIMAGEVVAFVQRGGRKVRRISGRSDNTPWATADMTVLAEHIAMKGIKQLAYSSNPNAILWAVTKDGKLLGLSIEIEQNVFGWHRHETDGTIESVAVVYGSDADEIWLSVLRGSNRTIERLDSQVFARDFSAYETMIYADSAKKFSFGSPTTSITGLSHLNGKTVRVLADGVEVADATVSGGSITLATAASKVVVGLPFESQIQPSRREVQTDKGTAQGMLWRPSRVVAYVHDSRGGQVSATPTSLQETLPYADAGLYSGVLETAIESNAGRSLDVTLKTSSPLPFNLGALVVKLDLYGD